MGYGVMVVEDEAVVAVGIRSMVQAAGHEVVGVAHSGEEALEMLRETQPQIALVDVRLPGIDGIETTRRMVQECGLIVIMLTAFADPEFIEGAANAGAFTYLLKPADPEMLKANFEMAMSRAADFNNLRQEADDVRNALETRKLAERAKHIIMQRLSMNEETAFSHLRQKCRNQNKTMRQAAEEIILADQAFLNSVEKDPPKKDHIACEN